MKREVIVLDHSALVAFQIPISYMQSLLILKLVDLRSLQTFFFPGVRGCTQPQIEAI